MRTFINWEDIVVKGRESGVKKTTCPNCSHTRKKKNDPCLYVNFSNGFAKCFNCEALSFRDNEQDFKEKTYLLPSQDWQNYTTLPGNLVKWVEEERKIKQHSLIQLGITYEKHYQPAKQKEVGNIVFNYFEGDKVVNKKYRSADKKFTQSSGTKNIFYNINSIIGEEECYIVEGEFDVLALHTAGVKNVISVPNGANDNDDVWVNSEKYLKDIKKFIIAVDNDDKGNDLKEKIAQRLGRYRCGYIEWVNKDANGDLIAGCIEQSLGSVKRFPVSGTFKVEDLIEDIMHLYDNGLPETIKPKDSSFGRLPEFFSVMRGHLCVITGIPSHGKSNFGEWFALNLVKDYDMKLSLYSPEHNPMGLHQTNLMQKAIGRSFWKDYTNLPRITKEDIERYKDWANEKIYLTGMNGELPTWDWLLGTFKEQMYSYGVDMFMIDAFNKVLLPNKNKDAIDEVLTKLTLFAQTHNVIIFLVAHPTKMRNGDNGLPVMPSLYDVSGSADFRNQTHDGFCIYRYFEDPSGEGGEGHTTFANLKTKFSFQGEIGKTEDFSYHIPSGRYYVKGTEPLLFDMTQPKIDWDEEIKNVIKPNEDFDNQDDMFNFKENWE